MQKIQPFLWYNGDAEDAARLYTSVFKNSKITSTMPGAPGQKPMGVSATIDGREFILLNGGPQYRPNQSISFTAHFNSEQEIGAAWEKLSADGKIMMELANYSWAEKYGWVEDRFGVNWQLTIAKDNPPTVPSFLFSGVQQGRAEEAVNFWMSLFPNSKIDFIARYESGESGPTGQIKYAHFMLADLPFIAMDSGHPMDVPFTPGISMFVNCTTQDEVDKYWNDLSEGGAEDRCGWLQDKFGVSWQIIPNTLTKLMSDKDPAKAGRVVQAMLGMKKIIIADLEAAYAGEPVEAA